VFPLKNPIYSVKYLYFQIYKNINLRLNVSKIMISERKKKRAGKIAFILNGLLFVLNGVVIVGEAKLFFGIIQIIAGLLNFGMLSQKIKPQTRNILDYAIFLINIVIALLIALDYSQQGKAYIQYAWIFISVLYFLALLYKIYLKKPVSS